MAVTGIARDIHNLMKNIVSFSDGQATIHHFESDEAEEMIVRIVPNGGLYKDGTFDFKLNLTPYPTDTPSVRCLTRIYHPNIDNEDDSEVNICLNLFCGDWTSDSTLEDVVQGILFLLYNPNLEDPLSSWFDSSNSYEEFAENVAMSLRGETVDDIEFERNCCHELEATFSDEEIVAILVEDILTSVMEMTVGESTGKSSDTAQIIPLNPERTNKTETALEAEPNMVSGGITHAHLNHTTELSNLNNDEYTSNNTEITDIRDLCNLNIEEHMVKKTEVHETTVNANDSDFVNIEEGTSVDDHLKTPKMYLDMDHSRSCWSFLYSDNLAPEISLMSAILPKVIQYLFRSVYLRSKKLNSSS